jgi:hypothetical protein
MRLRWLFILNSVIAWLAIGLDVVLTVGGVYPAVDLAPGDPGFGEPAGFAGNFSRAADVFSYFTTWSVVLVGVSTAMLALGRSDRWLAWLRVTSLVMITVTGVVQAALLAPVEHLVGWAQVADVLEHQVTPVVTLVVWLILGPRGWLGPHAIVQSLIVPIGWILYTMTRGVITGVYPYDFINPNRYGYGDVLLTVVQILVFGVAVGLVLWGVDWLLLRRMKSTSP